MKVILPCLPHPESTEDLQGKRKSQISQLLARPEWISELFSYAHMYVHV